MLAAKDLKKKKMEQLEEALSKSKESIRKAGNNLNKLSDKDLLDCKNTWENYPFGKLLLSKVFELLNDPNCDDFEYIKKNISAKHFKKLVNIDFTQPQDKFIKDFNLKK